MEYFMKKVSVKNRRNRERPLFLTKLGKSDLNSLIHCLELLPICYMPLNF